MPYARHFVKQQQRYTATDKQANMSMLRTKFSKASLIHTFMYTRQTLIQCLKTKTITQIATSI